MCASVLVRISACPRITAVWRDIISHQPQRWRSYAPDGIHPNEKACREVILPYMLRKIGFSPPSESATAAL